MSESTKTHKAHAPRKVTFAVFICSTSRYLAMQRGEESTDISGDTIETLLKAAGHTVLFRRVVSDEKTMIEHAVKSILANDGVEAAIFCGGTGITHSDITIETVSSFFEKPLPGFGEFFRRISYDKMGSGAITTRAVAGVVAGKVLFCIPGSPDAAKTAVELLISPEAGHIVKHARE
ncbi:MAG: MogA/MoaB family molybdenum cofactor biosynthesis protein [Candidatus Bathyarchaeota archaeon]|nr:MogA/MoaB family molybdenum cofactor biosynthesis protein [Candidatus Bathyarchaeota archaeon]